jgi:hypothetical protein
LHAKYFFQAELVAAKASFAVAIALPETNEPSSSVDNAQPEPSVTPQRQLRSVRRGQRRTTVNG